MLACCFRQTSKRHLLLWLTDGEDELDDESPSIKNQRRLAFSPSTNSIFIKTLDATTVSILFLASSLPLLLQLDSCSGLLRMSFWRFFHVAPHFLSKISTPLETCVGQKAHTDTSASHLLFTWFVLYVHILHHLPAETYAVTCLRLQIVMCLSGVEPGPQAWEGCMLPLHYRRSCS